MHDELIKNLRKMQSHEYCVLVSIDGFPAMQIIKQAADAIEELQKQLREEKVDNVNLTGWLAEEHAKAEDFENKLNLWRQDKIRRWIPVTERLPECDLGAEVGNIEWIICGMVHAGCFGRGGKYRDAYFRTWTDAKEGIDAKEADYWRAVTFPEPPKDGES